MKTYSKDDVINAIRDLLQNVTEVESIEHVGGNEFSIRIIISKTDKIPVIPAYSYKQFLDTFGSSLGHKFNSEGSISSTDDRMEYLDSKSGEYWTRQINVSLDQINVEG
ncbi:hypothetical protein F4054_10840 [Candidatus Poribacteria bacterium]|nr:hypothetical protein [Candidatus Poribacteria bacterium]MYG05590.1 hypothetical protein [Candidatus Poribacteria bacterium]MYK22741.1 hypothetical protein [Candidatus Poribacteria bacterium]